MLPSSETLFALVSDHGALALAIATFLSCLAVPVPTSLMMLAAGAFVASGDMAAGPALAGAFAGAVLGDQAGFGLGRVSGTALTGWLRRNPARAATLARAEASMARRGGLAVFLSRWLFSPLGPYVNFLAGGAAMNWGLFTLAGLLGEAVWVTSYIGLGYGFGGNLALLADMLANSVALLSAGLIAAVLGLTLWRGARISRRRARPAQAIPPRPR